MASFYLVSPTHPLALSCTLGVSCAPARAPLSPALASSSHWGPLASCLQEAPSITRSSDSVLRRAGHHPYCRAAHSPLQQAFQRETPGLPFLRGSMKREDSKGAEWPSVTEVLPLLLAEGQGWDSCWSLSSAGFCQSGMAWGKLVNLPEP